MAGRDGVDRWPMSMLDEDYIKVSRLRYYLPGQEGTTIDGMHAKHIKI